MIFHREEGGREGGVSSGTDQAALNLHENKKRRAVSLKPAKPHSPAYSEFEDRNLKQMI